MGQTSKSMQSRLRQHGSQPPRRMACDLKQYGHIQRFQVEILAAGLTNIQAHHTEEHYIKILASGPTSYNNLPGCPGRCKLFLTLQQGRCRRDKDITDRNAQGALKVIQAECKERG